MYYLYVKTHIKTGLKYLGYTKQNPYKYLGSGKYWRRHLDKHGPEHTTEIIFSSENYEDIVEEGKFFSHQYEVVSSEKWANLKEEVGDGGWDHVNNATPDIKNSIINKRKTTFEQKSPNEMSKINKAKGHSGENNYWHGKNRSGKNNPRFGISLNEDTKQKISIANTGKIPSLEVRSKMSASQSKRWDDNSKAERSAQYKELGIKPPSPKGMKWFNDGEKHMRALTHPGDPWVPGRLFQKRVRNKNGV